MLADDSDGVSLVADIVDAVDDDDEGKAFVGCDASFGLKGEGDLGAGDVGVES